MSFTLSVTLSAVTTLPDGLDEHQAGVGFLARHDTDGDAQVDQGDDDRRAGQVHDVLVHRGDRAADDDLVTVAGLRHRPQHSLHGLQPVLVYFARVDEFEAQASRAVRQALDVARATDRFDDLRCS